MARTGCFDISLKRVYEPATEADGVRILVKRLWPRGVSQEKASIRRWVKEIAPAPTTEVSA